MGHAVMRRGKETKCICGNRVPQGGESLRYLGLVRRFCSAACAREFDRHPWVYDEYLGHRGLRGLGLLRALHPERPAAVRPVDGRRRIDP